MTKSLLAIDTSTENCSAAVTVKQQLQQQMAESPREHSQRLLPFVDQVLKAANVTLEELDGLVVGCGPGSFTGVRIGVSVAQGLAFSAHLPVYPVSSLQALAQKCIRLNAVAAQPPQLILVAIDARMNEVYYAVYENINGIAVALTEPAVAKPTAALFSNILVQLKVDASTQLASAGTGWDNYADILAADLPVAIKPDASTRLPEAQDMLQLVQAEQVNSVTAEQLEPLYVRNEVTWKKLPGR